MTREELLDEIRRLPIEQRIELLEAIARSVSEEVLPHARDVTLASRLRGIIKFDGPPPSDEEIKDEYARYLTEKYS